MSLHQTLRLIRAQDLQLRFTMDRPTPIAGWSVTFKVADALGGTAKVTKTVGAGVTLTDTARGVLTVSLARADTATLPVTTALAKGKGYVWELTRTDAGYQTVLPAASWSWSRRSCKAENHSPQSHRGHRENQDYCLGNPFLPSLSFVFSVSSVPLWFKFFFFEVSCPAN